VTTNRADRPAGFREPDLATQLALLEAARDSLLGEIESVEAEIEGTTPFYSTTTNWSRFAAGMAIGFVCVVVGACLIFSH
jgi:hypothetical protein